MLLGRRGHLRHIGSRPGVHRLKNMQVSCSGSNTNTPGSPGAQPNTLRQAKKLKRTELSLAPRQCPPSSRFKVLQWNILADGLAQHGDFIRVSPEVLEWDYRFQLVLAEVAESNADIICIQELNHYDQLLRQLRLLGYEGTFLPKNCSPAARYKCPADGLAIFHSTKRFEYVGTPLGHIYLNEQGEKQSQGFLQVRLRDRLADRELLIATTHLKSKEGSVEEQTRTRQIRQLLHHLKRDLVGASPSVATAAQVPAMSGGTPGYSPEFNGCSCATDDAASSMDDRTVGPWGYATGNGNGTPSYGDAASGLGGVADSDACVVEAGQGAAAWMAGAVPGSNNGYPGSNGYGSAGAAAGPNGAATASNGAVIAAGDLPPVIIAGDFNATPESVPCREMKAHPAGFQSIWDVKPYKAAAENGNGSGSGSGSWSNGSTDEASEFSTWKFRSKGESKRIIDHIWFTRGRRLVPTSRWRMLTEAEIGPAALPSPAYASDHQALCCEFEWRD